MINKQRILNLISLTLLAFTLIVNLWSVSLLTDVLSLRFSFLHISIFALSFLLALLFKNVSRALLLIFVTLIFVMFLVPPLVIVSYASSFNISFLSLNDILEPILQSDIKETYEFILQNNLLGVIFIASLLVLLSIYSTFKTLLNYQISSKKKVFLIFIFAVISFSVTHIGSMKSEPYITKKPLFLQFTHFFKHYQKELNSFKKIQKEYAASDKIKASIETSKPGVHVMIIGESLAKNHMSLYEYSRETTPRVNAMINDQSFIFHKKAHSNHTHTMQALSLSLTAANQYNGLNFKKSANLVQVARSAGYKTYWITNQQIYGRYENKVSIIAKRAENVKALNTALNTYNSEAHDQRAFNYAKQVISELIKKEQSAVVFIHIMGSHGSYCRRFPGEFDLFKDSDFLERVNCYDNSVLYNDFLVEDMISFLKKKNTLSSLIYFSDHGEEVVKGFGHNSQKITESMHKIPLLFFLSKDWIKMNESEYKNLNLNMSKVFTNDLVFETSLDLWNIKSEGVQRESKYSLLSDKYLLLNPMTLHGTKKIKNDSIE